MLRNESAYYFLACFSRLSAIADYFAIENVEAGERLLSAFNQKCQQLINFPNMGREYNNLRPGLRGLPLNGYIILY